jgi:hypothetical protein
VPLSTPTRCYTVTVDKLCKIRAGPRNLSFPGRLIISRHFKLTIFKVFGTELGWRVFLRGVAQVADNCPVQMTAPQPGPVQMAALQTGPVQMAAPSDRPCANDRPSDRPCANDCPQTSSVQMAAPQTGPVKMAVPPTVPVQMAAFPQPSPLPMAAPHPRPPLCQLFISTAFSFYITRITKIPNSTADPWTGPAAPSTSADHILRTVDLVRILRTSDTLSQTVILAFTVWGLDTGVEHTQKAAHTVIRTVQQQHADGLSRSVTVSCTFKLVQSHLSVPVEDKLHLFRFLLTVANVTLCCSLPFFSPCAPLCEPIIMAMTAVQCVSQLLLDTTAGTVGLKIQVLLM